MPMIGEQYTNLEQQQSSYRLGMWIFLASEIMLFGGAFLAYTIGRLAHFEAFAAGSRELDLTLGTLNTAVLLTSSWTMAQGVARARSRRWSAASAWIVLTACLGLTFLGIKLYEWSTDWKLLLAAAGPEKLFWWLYYVMTGLHALHMGAGLLCLLALLLVIRRFRFLVQDPSPVILGGLYWHLVDLIWIFLYPCLYLVGR